MAYFPIFVDLQGKPCLVVGGGRVSLRKTKTLLEYGATVTVVSPKVLPEFESLDTTILLRNFETKDLQNVFLVVTATNDTSLNSSILERCKALNILCNSATDTTSNGYTFPAVARLNDVSVGVSTSSKSPYASSLIKSEIECTVLPKYAKAVEVSSVWKPLIVATVQDPTTRGRIIRQIVDYTLTMGEPTSDIVESIINDTVGNGDSPFRKENI